MDSGTAKTMAPIVTSRVPTMSGKIPYSGSAAVGAQSGPRRKWRGPTREKIKNPSRNKKSRMKVTMITAKKAVKKKMVLIDFSFSRENRACPADVARALKWSFTDFTISPPENFTGIFPFAA
jgi:hypothetical protein